MSFVRSPWVVVSAEFLHQASFGYSGHLGRLGGVHALVPRTPSAAV